MSCGAECYLLDVAFGDRSKFTDEERKKAYDKIKSKWNKRAERRGKWRPFDPDDKSTWPEDGGEVLATAADWNDVLVLYFNPHEKSWHSDIGFDLEIDEISAWTPLPAPYEPEVET